ncbi:MAG: hypothetical protein OEY01_14405 [Desulfobulbaceae bacterium]|nr:hypothetical protein [Desulfobulbaceae bacterium]
MKKAAIVLDDWKLPIFKKTLDNEGYEFSKFSGPTDGCITLQVETDDLNKLAKVVQR